uniref:AAA+ ATPase domain-containing protein n=1 Tax=Acrobeloides nanus TaxID=290746 RepID=A0A914DFN3_9BILA
MRFQRRMTKLLGHINGKFHLLAYVSALLQLSRLDANTNILSMNRLVLLYGPPGTGKTTLCKALAQRLSIHQNSIYKRSIFIEVNSHSLFSKWFSESGKLVLKMFNQIEELAEDPKTFVCVLIDEVESLTMGRNASFQKHEPSDSVRAVNAVLTQIDKIRRFNNVLVLTTSNITEALDAAFVDRTDICRFVGNPTTHAIYSMLFDAIKELQRVGVINREQEVEPFCNWDTNGCNDESKCLWNL